MSDELQKTPRFRPENSQRFPSINVQRAIERARELYKVANIHAVPLSVAAKGWGFSEKSSSVGSTVAAVKAYGLIDDGGNGLARKVQLTERGLQIIKDFREISPDRDLLIREAALTPPLHKDFFDSYNGSLPPSDEAFRAELILSRGFQEEAADEFMRLYKTTFSFAKLNEMPTDSETNISNSDAPASIGLPATPAPQQTNSVGPNMPEMINLGENDVKVLLDGKKLRVTAYVDKKGLKRLFKVLKANAPLLEDDDDDANEEDEDPLS